MSQAQEINKLPIILTAIITVIATVAVLHFRRCYEGVEGVQKVSLTKPTGGISPQPWCRPP